METTTAAATDRVLDLARANNMRIIDGRIVTENGDQSCSLADAVAAETAAPTNVAANTGWLFGDGIEWADVRYAELHVTDIDADGFRQTPPLVWPTDIDGTRVPANSDDATMLPQLWLDWLAETSDGDIAEVGTSDSGVVTLVRRSTGQTTEHALEVVIVQR